MTDQELLKRIVCAPQRMTGKPVIEGTRLTVDYVLNLLGHGATVDQIIEEYEGLESDDIRACLLFAANALSNTTFMPLPVEST